MKKIKLNYGSGYYATSDGNIYSEKTDKELKYVINRHGYKMINLSINGKCVTFQLHRLIAEAFIPNPNNFPVVNHIDGNKLNNKPENLEWTTMSGNIRHAFKTGLIKVDNTKSGFKRKFTTDDIYNIRRMYATTVLTIRDIAKIFGVTNGTIISIIKKKSYMNVNTEYDNVDLINKTNRRKIDNADAEKIKDLISKGYSDTQIQKAIGYTRGSIYAIRKGKTFVGNKISNGVYGEKSRKLDIKNLETIFEKYYIEKLSCAKIGLEYGVKKDAIRRIVNGLSYKDVTEDLIKKYKNKQ